MSSWIGLPSKVRVVCDRHEQRPHVVTFERLEQLSADFAEVESVTWWPARKHADNPADVTVHRLLGGERFDPEVHADQASETRYTYEVWCRQCNAPRRGGRWRQEKLAPVLEVLRAHSIDEISLDALDKRYANAS